MKVYDSGWSQPHVKVTLTPTLTPITTPRPIVSQPAGQSARPSTSETQATPAGFPSYGGYDSADGAAHTSNADRFGATRRGSGEQRALLSSQPNQPNQANQTSVARRRRLSLAIVLLVASLYNLQLVILFPIIPEIVEFFSLSEAKVSWIVASKQVGMLVSNMVWPRLSDVLGRRAVLLFLFLLLALAPFAEALVFLNDLSFAAFLVFRCLGGAFAGTQTVMRAYVADISTGDDLALFMPWVVGAEYFGATVGMLLGGFLMDQYGWSLAALFILCGCIVLLCTVLTLFVADPEGIAPPDTPAFWRRLARTDPELLQKLEREKAEKEPAGGMSIGKCIGGYEGWVAILLITCITEFLFYGQNEAIIAYFPVTLERRFQMSAEKIGLIMCVYRLITFLALVVGYDRVTSRVGVAYLATAGLLVSAVAALSLDSCGICPSLCPVCPRAYLSLDLQDCIKPSTRNSTSRPPDVSRSPQRHE